MRSRSCSILRSRNVLMRPPSKNPWQRQYVFGFAVRPSSVSLTPISRLAISLFLLVEGFQWNFLQTFVTRTRSDTAEKVYEVRGQKSRLQLDEMHFSYIDLRRSIFVLHCIVCSLDKAKTDHGIYRIVSEERTLLATLQQKQRKWLGHVLRHDSLLNIVNE